MERLLDYFVPEKYVLDFGINKFNKKTFGVVSVNGEVKNETVKFHAVKLNIRQVFVNGKEVEYETDEETLIINNVALGETEFVIVFDGLLNENMEGVYLSTYDYNGEIERIVATQFESHYARKAFPCIDEPEAKAVFELKLTVPEVEDEVVISNMPVAQTKKYAKVPDGKHVVFYDDDKKVADKYREYVFEPTPRMSTYLLAWVIGKFHGKTVTNEHGVEITTYCSLAHGVDSVDFANEIAARSLEFYDDNFGVPYPLKKLDQVALPDFEAGAMENWGLVTYRESMMLVSADATLGTKKSVALTVAHELSHQWFGDLVTMKWWDDLWLNESFASVMEYYAVDAIHPEFNIFEGFFTGDCQAALNRDAYSGVQSVHQEVRKPEEIATLFDSAIVYAKGARLMLMLIRLMGWDSFCKGLVDYFNEFKYKNTVGDDLWESLKPYASFEPRKLMHAFTDRPGYPVITNEGDDFREFSQKRFLLDGGEMTESDWPLPKITEDMSGHYILNLSEEEFEDRLNNFDRLGLEEKLRLLIDRDLITKSGLVSADCLAPLAMKFKNESAPAVWNKVAGLVGNLKIYFDDESEDEKLLKEYTFNLINDKLDEIGLVTRDDDDEDMIRLRANLLALDYYAEDEGRLKLLDKMYDDDYMKMDKEIRGDILCAKAYLEPEIVDEFLVKYKEFADPDVKFDYLFAACSVRDEKQAEKLLALMGDYKMVKPQDQLYLFVYLYRNPKTRMQAFEWVCDNWELVKKMGGEKSLNDYPTIIGRLARTREELKKFVDFFGTMREDLVVARAVEIGENEIRARVELIEKDGERVKEAVKKI